MTIYGLDISAYQHGLSLANVKSQGFAFVVIKATQGDNYLSSYFERQVKAAKAADLLYASYIFLDSDKAAGEHVAWYVKFVKDKSIPIWLDCEPSGTSKPTLALAHSIAAMLNTRGYRCHGLYLPHWYWQVIGKPPIGKQWALWSSDYLSNPQGFASNVYATNGADNGPGWLPYGDHTPLFWQFGSHITVTGYSGNIDANAFKGSLENLVKTGLFNSGNTGTLTLVGHARASLRHALANKPRAMRAYRIKTALRILPRK